jgi:hypothetical protein
MDNDQKAIWDNAMLIYNSSTLNIPFNPALEPHDHTGIKQFIDSASLRIDHLLIQIKELKQNDADGMVLAVDPSSEIECIFDSKIYDILPFIRTGTVLELANVPKRYYSLVINTCRSQNYPCQRRTLTLLQTPYAQWCIRDQLKKAIQQSKQKVLLLPTDLIWIRTRSKRSNRKSVSDTGCTRFI